MYLNQSVNVFKDSSKMENMWFKDIKLRAIEDISISPLAQLLITEQYFHVLIV